MTANWLKDTTERLKIDRTHPVVNAWIAFALGIVFMVGVTLALFAPAWRDLGAFCIMISFYHMWEWSYVSLFHQDELSADSFLINHSVEWILAWVIAISEYFIEHFFWPDMKSRWYITLPALCVVIFGQSLRTVSMFHAGSNFAHLIEEESRADHKLVTTGVYSFSRHPSYLGWFWWTIGMAGLLANPVSVVVFAGFAWYFFADRIPYEESTLIEQFGEDYIEYKKRVPVRIPFIN